MKEKLIKILYIFLLLHPILDLVTALMTRFNVGFISIGIVVRGLFLALLLIYFFFFNSSKYKWKLTKYLALLFIFCIVYFITKSELIFNKEFFVNEVIYMFKYMYFPIMLVTLFSLYSESFFDKNKIINIFVINLIAYSLLLIIPFITNTSFNSYAKNKGKGIIGWFYSANEIGGIMAIIYPLLFLYINKKIKISIVISMVLILFSSLLIGTKVSFFGCIAAIVIVLIYYLLNHKKYKKMHFILPIALLVFSFLISSNLPVMKNINSRVKWYNRTGGDTTAFTVNKDNNSNDSNSKANNTKTTDNSNNSNLTKDNAKVLLSSRDRLYSRIYDIYKARNLNEKLFGIGFSNRDSIGNKKIEKLIEMDFFDVLFRYGIVGFIIYYIPVIVVFINILKYLIKTKFKLLIEEYVFLYSILVGTFIAFISGHTFSSPPVSIYLALLMIFSIYLFRHKKKNKLNKKNVYFLALHLGQGGIERATINAANALCKRKNVTIISFYHLDSDMYEIDPSINIKYLYEGGPNREELMDALKNKSIISIIKNGFKAVNILLKKKYLMIKEIKNIKEGIIISTTIKFSKFLNYYGEDSVLKVVQEHKYHNNDKKYLKDMKYNYGNINYIMALTPTLKKDYEKLFKDNKNIKVVLMPNMLSSNYYKSSNLNNNIVVSTNRLDKDKRINEIIDIAYKVKDMNWKFYLIGEGNERKNLEKQIKDLGLKDSVKLLGKLPNDKVIETLENASIYVSTSISEGFGISLIEACSVGLPCIIYEVENDLSDIVTDNKNGFLIKNRNEDEFVEKLKLLMNNKRKREIFSKQSLIMVKKYSNEEITNKWFDFIDKARL